MMSELVNPVGLGLAARGSVSDAVAWTEEARRQGVESVWIHDSYFERDAVSFASAIASQVADIRVGLGALNPYTRHPVLIAMTVSAIDEMSPGRVILALGTGLPLRLGQMGIPYIPEEGVERVSRCIDILRALWNGERLPPGAPGLPPLQPMFPPVHRVPVYIAAYRSPMLKLAGEKADGYLARPAESIPALRVMLAKIRAASAAAGRAEDAVATAGYLLTIVDSSRREALNRAKREPFVIYMMSVLSDVSLRRAGFERELRDRIAEAWKQEDYHGAAELIPDSLLDAFVLCGTPTDVAEGAWRYRETGLELPILQPVVQEQTQVEATLEAAVVYGSEEAAAEPIPALPDGSSPRSEIGKRGLGRRLAAWVEVTRPFSFTASVVPVSVGGALASAEGVFYWPLFLAAVFGALLLQVGTNIINELFDVRRGVDSITSPRASHAIVKGRVDEREAFLLGASAFALATVIGLWLIHRRGWPVAALGLIGIVAGFGYTAPPLQYKYRGFGVPLVFLLMGPTMVGGAYYVVTGSFGWGALAASIPVGFLVAAILHGNEWRDISEDARAGIVTLSNRMGRRLAHFGYVFLVVGAYVALGLAVMAGALSTSSLLPLLSLPLFVRVIRASELGAAGQQRAIAKIDLETARLHAVFGALLVAGLAASALGA